MCNEKKDFSLLRPFDLEAANSGEDVCWYADGLKLKYIGQSTRCSAGCFEWTEGQYIGTFETYSERYIRMAPLCWVRTSVEDDTLKPVYRGGTVYTGNYSCNFVVDKEDGGRIFFTNGGWLFVKDVTFTTPKVKRKIKMFGYRNKHDCEFIIRDVMLEGQTYWVRFPQIDTTIEIEE